MKTKKKKNRNFVKENICPYCTYPCESAGGIDGAERSKPHPGCISFCLMCCRAATWDANMKLVKFDLNSIPNLLERNRIKRLGFHIEEFWEKNPELESERRNRYLKIMEERNDL
jgi:hypothetical protein